jgi:hypothetical protein
MSGDERRLTNALERTLGLYEHLGEESRLVLEPGYNQNEVFDSQFERRAREIQPTPGPEQGVPIIPSKRGPWTGNNQLGIERAFAADANNRQTILKLDEWDFPDVWTIALGLNEFTATTGGFDVTALIEFGVGGVTQSVEIDWLNGSGISLPMNALNLVAQYNLIDQELPGEVPDDLRLRVSISKMPAQNLRPTRSYWVTTPANIFTIPPFAKAVHISPIDAVPNPFAFYNQSVAACFMTRVDAPRVMVGNYLFSQFCSFIDTVNSKVGAPAFLPIPPYARALHFVTVGGGGVPSDQQCVIQYLIGL